MGIHPIIVHFPIALLITGVGFEAVALLFKREHLRRPALYLLVLGLAGAVAAWLTGSVAAEQAERLLPREGAIYTHRNFATLAILLFGALLALRAPLSRKSVGLYLGLAAISAFVLFLAGRTGGEMVCGERGMIVNLAGDRFPFMGGERGEQGEGFFNEGFERRRGGEGGEAGILDRAGGAGEAGGEGGELGGEPGGRSGGREAGEAGEAGETGERSGR